ncbi:hypothetical protein BD408DRAFT_194755, partial [Parasitella parasitica]
MPMSKDLPSIVAILSSRLPHRPSNSSAMPMALSFSYMMLLPAARSLALVGAPINTVTMILRTMNAIPRRFLPADRNPIECLLLPIPAIIKSTTLRYKLAKKPKSATVGDIFELQVFGFFLSPIPGNRRLPSHLTFVARRFHQALTRTDCLFHPLLPCLVWNAQRLASIAKMTAPHIQTMLNFASFRKG